MYKQKTILRHIVMSFFYGVIMEIWKDIKNYEGLYQVSNLGRVKNKEDMIMKQRVNPDGYYRINLYKNGNRQTVLIHRLVAQAFINNPNEYNCINHKDENKLNNKVENLEWCTHEYNVAYGTARLRGALHTKKPIEQYTLDGVFVKRYDGIIDAQKELGTSSYSLIKCLKGKKESFYNYIWKYVDTPRG